MAPGGDANNPLFTRVKAAFAAATEGNGLGFGDYLAPDHDLALEAITDSGPKKAPITVRTFSAIKSDCIGPYFFDEGTTWVQLSWICRVDGAGPLSSTLSFQNSPELTLTVWFEDRLIKSIEAREAFMIPGAPRVPMEAYATMSRSR